MRNKVLAVVVVAALAAGGFGATWWFMRSPHFALYQVGKAIHSHDPGLFMTYVDVSRILQGSKDELLNMFLPEQVKKDQREMLRQIMGAFMGPLSEQVKERVARLVADKERENLPTSWTLVWAAKVDKSGESALALLQDGQNGRQLRLGLQRGDDRYWRVVEINAQDLRALLEEHLRDKIKSAVPAASPNGK